MEREGSGEGKSQRDDSGALTRRGRNRRTSEKQQAGSGLDIWVNFWVTQAGRWGRGQERRGGVEEREVTWDGWGCGLGARGREREER